MTYTVTQEDVVDALEAARDNPNTRAFTNASIVALIEAVRIETLERAAEVADMSCPAPVAKDIAAAIRNLKGKSDE